MRLLKGSWREAAATGDDLTDSSGVTSASWNSSSAEADGEAVPTRWGSAAAAAAVIDAIPFFVFHQRPDGTLMNVNQAYADYHGEVPADLTGTNVLELIDEQFRTAVAHKIRSFGQLTPDNCTLVEEFMSTRADGAPVWHEWADRALFDEHGRVDSIVTIAKDVSERRILSVAIEEQAANLVERSDNLTTLTDTENPGSLRATMTGAVELVTDLTERMSQIARLSETIGEVADQTNLLSLNATIEAARAGEHGKGFSVVAGEVKTLAGKTKESVESIENLATELTRTVDELATIMTQVADLSGDVGDTVGAVRDVASVLSELAAVGMEGVERTNSL
ncbi:MAG: methyl-accepting chemotaxis protein [Actinomycetota bacterium]